MSPKAHIWLTQFLIQEDLNFLLESEVSLGRVQMYPMKGQFILSMRYFCCTIIKLKKITNAVLKYFSSRVFQRQMLWSGFLLSSAVQSWPVCSALLCFPILTFSYPLTCSLCSYL